MRVSLEVLLGTCLCLLEEAAANPAMEVRRAAFPWLHELLAWSDGQRDELLRRSWARGCVTNRSLVNRFKYQDFLDYTKERGVYERTTGPIVTSVMVPALIRSEDRRNRHLLECIPAVVDALNLHRNLVLLTALHYGPEDSSLWDLCFQNVRAVRRALRVLVGEHSSQDVQDLIKSVRMSSRWSSRAWIEEAWEATSASWQKLVASQASWGSLVQGTQEVDVSEEQHLRLIADSKRLLDALIEEGLIRSWFVGRGTMIFAMRYGGTRGTLPSGIQDLPRLPPVDVDSFVLTDNWAILRSNIARFAEAFNFSWCGYQHGWPQNILSCLRPHGELELNLAQDSWKSSIFPTTTCVVEAVCDNASLQRHLLPCPRQPREFMSHLWTGDFANLTECLPLPSALNGTRAELTKDDVEWLWSKALEIRDAGYASLADLWRSCKDHPWSNFANELADRPPPPAPP